MDNVIQETNTKLLKVIEELKTNKDNYQEKYNEISKAINEKLEQVKEYKENYYEAKQKIDSLNSDIEDFKNQYQTLVNKFKDDELSNILISANKEISAKINDRKLKIQKDTDDMNKLVSEAETIKDELVKLNATKKALEICLNRSMDMYKFYEKMINNIVNYSTENPTDLCSYFKDEKQEKKEKIVERKDDEKIAQEKITSEAFDFNSIVTNDIVNF